tara:strand:+ start:262 stop:378 length:117 start_codon:yes stop_codon:yes gene_type:complete
VKPAAVKVVAAPLKTAIAPASEYLDKKLGVTEKFYLLF